MAATDVKVLGEFVARLEHLDALRRANVADFNEILAEAHALGFDKKALRKVIAERRKQDPAATLSDVDTFRAYFEAFEE
jgi:uncharacterized protein (UPF0335 family)